MITPAAPSGTRARSNSLVGTWQLTRLALRRDRARLPTRLVLLAVVPSITPPAFDRLFPNEAARADYAAGLGADPALRALQGPIFGTNLGALTAARSLTFTAVLVALLSVLTVVRHTRAEEEAGRRELLGATVVGRQAGLGAALIVVAGADLALGAAVTAGLASFGLPLPGCAAMGLALAAVGVVLGALAAVAAQVTETSRAASGLALAALGLAFVVRAAGDAGSPSWLSWLSPLGWAARVRPFAGERWWVLAPPFVTAVTLAGVAFGLSARRDLAAGLLPTRPGPPNGALAGPFGLARRLQRGTLWGWTAAFVVAGSAFGGIARGVGELLGSSPQVVRLLRLLGGGDGLADVFLAAEFGILGLLASAYAIAATLRLRSEETDGRAEVVLATSVGRTRWAASHLLVAVAGPAVLLTGAGLTAGLVYGMAIGDVTGQVPRLVGGTLEQLPAIWVLVGIALALFGVAPRLAGGAWAALVAFLLVGQFGQLLQLPQWALDLSPFTHLPRALPRTLGRPVDLAPLLWLTAIAAALMIIGLAGFRRRNLD
jgi:ABC-2 type transport system permease protein